MTVASPQRGRAMSETGRLGPRVIIAAGSEKKLGRKNSRRTLAVSKLPSSRSATDQIELRCSSPAVNQAALPKLSLAQIE